MSEAAKSHRKIAASITELVVMPFGKWCDAHESRVQGSHDDLQARIKAHDKQADSVRKLRSTYFNKCRQVEDLEEENKLAFQEPEKEGSPKAGKSPQTPTLKLPEDDLQEEEPIEIGDDTYAPEQVKIILTAMLNNIRIGETKVPILGTYQNVSTGSDITEYIQRTIGATSVSHAERIGQDLVSHGFLRLVGNVGNSFANSSKMNYQWRSKVFHMTGIPEKRGPARVSTTSSLDGDNPLIGSMGEMLSKWNPLDNQHPNEVPLERLQREARESDEKYKAGVKKLDLLRCSLEEAMIDHLKFMERCELDRLKAIKAVLLDFSGAISNSIPSLQSTVDNMMLYQESVQPLGDLRYLIENYRTGSFSPKVPIYDNYWNQVDEQTFGVDVEARARGDRKRVPVIVTTILMFLDNHYPDLEGDEVRRNIWLVDVPIAATHHLRNSINNGKAVPREMLERYEIPIVASVLKLYLLELPGRFECAIQLVLLLTYTDSLVSSQVYEIIKTLYSNPDSTASETTRVTVLQNTLGQLRLANIATLDALATHFTRLIDLTSADEEYVAQLAQMLSPCVLRPRVQSSLTIQERHAYRLVRDLLDHKDEIFGELKRASSQTPAQPSVISRPRISSNNDESNRQANMEARNRAIADRTRAVSPSPAAVNGRHRRDKSVGPSAGRFPVITSPTHSAQVAKTRGSLEVPDTPTTPRASELSQQVSDPAKQLPEIPVPNGLAEYIAPVVAEEPKSEDTVGVEKKNSLNRSGHVSSVTSRFNRKAGAHGSQPSFGLARQSGIVKRDSQSSTKGSVRDSVTSLSEVSRGEDDAERRPSTHGSLHGVELSDKPMDD